MLKRIVFIAWACMAVAAAHAQTTMAKMWTSMPDSLAPAYLKADKRRAMVDYYEMGETAEVTHELQGTSVMDTLSTQYARVTLSGAQSVQLALLPTAQGDTLLCRVVTFAAPAHSPLPHRKAEWNSSIQNGTDSTQSDSYPRCPPPASCTAPTASARRSSVCCAVSLNRK